MTTSPRTPRVTPVPRPDGCDLHVEGYARDLLRDVIGVLAEQPDLMDLFDRVVDGDAPQHDPHRPDVPSRDDVLIDAIVRSLNPASLAIRVHGPVLDKLAGTLAAISRSQGGRPVGAVPQQRKGEAA